MSLITYVYTIYIIFFIYYFLQDKKEENRSNKSKKNIQIFLDKVFFSRIIDASKNYTEIEKMYKIFNIVASYYNLNDIAIFDKEEKKIIFCYADKIKKFNFCLEEISNLQKQYYYQNNSFFHIKNCNGIIIIISSYKNLELELNDYDNLNIKNVIFNFIVPSYEKEKLHFRNYFINQYIN